jgi:ABC-type transporter Mla subunit MlaD
MRFARDDAKVGLLVLAAALLFGGLLFQRSLSAIFKKETTLQVRLESAGDLMVGTEVQLQGWRVGQVNRVDLEREGVQYRFVATLGIRPDILLWKGTKGVVVAKLFGGAFMDLQLPPVEARQEVLQPGAILEGGTAASLATLIDEMQEFVRGLNEVLTDLRSQFKKKGIGAVLDHPDLKKAIQDLDATLLDARALIKEGQGAVKRGDAALGRNLESLEKSLGILQEVLEKRSGEIDTIVVNLAEVLEQINGLSAETRTLLKTDGPEIEAALKALRRNLESSEELLELLKAKPNRAVWGTPSEAERQAARRKVQAAREGETKK